MDYLIHMQRICEGDKYVIKGVRHQKNKFSKEFINKAAKIKFPNTGTKVPTLLV